MVANGLAKDEVSRSSISYNFQSICCLGFLVVCTEFAFSEFSFGAIKFTFIGKKEDGRFRSCKWAHTSPEWQILGSGLFCKYIKISDESTAEIGFLKRMTRSDLDLRTHIDEKNWKTGYPSSRPKHCSSNIFCIFTHLV